MRCCRSMQFASLMFAVWCAASSNVILAVDDANFDSQVAPALSAKCVACHRPENSKGGLDLTTLAGALQGGDSGPAIVVREPDQSALLLRAIAAPGERPEMPAEGEPLTNEEAAAVRQWIADGAAWPFGPFADGAACTFARTVAGPLAALDDLLPRGEERDALSTAGFNNLI